MSYLYSLDVTKAVETIDNDISEEFNEEELDFFVE